MMTGKHGLPSLGDQNLNMMGPGSKSRPWTMVPPAFNPVFWLLQTGADQQAGPGSSSSQMEDQQRFGFPLEMRLGPFAPSSMSSPPLPHDMMGFHHTALMRQADRGDLSSITVNLHHHHQSSSRALTHWEAGNHHTGSEPSSSCTSNTTEITPAFRENNSANHLWVNPDSRDESYEPSPEHEGGATDCDTVMKWCDLLPTQDSQAPAPSTGRSQGLQQHQQQPMQQMGWAMQVQGSGPEHHSMYIEPVMSQELQRMAAVLDQI